MAKKTDKANTADIQRQFDGLKEKHPDTLLLFRKGDFYEAYKEDAVKAASVLSVTLTERTVPGWKEPVKYTAFPHDMLDTYLPRLIRAGQRVAICEAAETQKLEAKEKARTKDESIPNDKDMARKKKEQATQENPTQAATNKAEEKTAKTQEAKAGQATKTEKSQKAEDTAKQENKAEAKKERKPREPQMVTPDGGKVTHGHAYQSKANPEDWYFTAKIDGKQLKPQKMSAADLAAYQKKEITVPQLMECYYPTKLMPKVPEESFKFPRQMEGPEGTVAIEKFNVYKEKDVGRADYGKYKFYAQVGEAKMSAVASRQDLNAYFDRVATPAQLVEKNFGERLHLKSAYEKYKLPEGVDVDGIRVAKDRADNKWKVSADLGDRGRTAKHEISFDDGYSLFRAKTATREQIAAKYLNTEIKGLLAGNAAKVEKSVSMKM